MKLLGNIIPDTHFADRVWPAFQLIDMLCVVAEEALSPISAATLMAPVQLLHSLHLQREVAFKLRLVVAADIDFPMSAVFGVCTFNSLRIAKIVGQLQLQKTVVFT